MLTTMGRALERATQEDSLDCLLKGPGWRVVDEPETAAMGGVAGEGGGRWKSSGTKGKICSEGKGRTLWRD